MKFTKKLNFFRFLRMRNAALLIQKIWRGYGPRKRYLRLNHGCLRLQARIRSRAFNHEYKQKRNAIIALQVSKKIVIMQEITW